MTGDAPEPRDPATDDPPSVPRDADALKEAHDRTGRLLKQAGLPFEEEEFDDAEPSAEDADESDADGSDAGGSDAGGSGEPRPSGD